MPEKEFVFHIGQEKEPPFRFNLDRTVRELLVNFLQRTNSVQTLDKNKIFFTFNLTVLNRDETLLNKCLKDVITTKHSQVKIIVKDRGRIIGGIKNEE